jgi:hypothetical protein
MRVYPQDMPDLISDCTKYTCSRGFKYRLLHPCDAVSFPTVIAKQFIVCALRSEAAVEMEV